MIQKKNLLVLLLACIIIIPNALSESNSIDASIEKELMIEIGPSSYSWAEFDVDCYLDNILFATLAPDDYLTKTMSVSCGAHTFKFVNTNDDTQFSVFNIFVVDDIYCHCNLYLHDYGIDCIDVAYGNNSEKIYSNNEAINRFLLGFNYLYPQYKISGLDLSRKR